MASLEERVAGLERRLAVVERAVLPPVPPEPLLEAKPDESPWECFERIQRETAEVDDEDKPIVGDRYDGP